MPRNTFDKGNVLCGNMRNNSCYPQFTNLVGDSSVTSSPISSECIINARPFKILNMTLMNVQNTFSFWVLNTSKYNVWGWFLEVIVFHWTATIWKFNKGTTGSKRWERCIFVKVTSSRFVCFSPSPSRLLLYSHLSLSQLPACLCQISNSFATLPHFEHITPTCSSRNESRAFLYQRHVCPLQPFLQRSKQKDELLLFPKAAATPCSVVLLSPTGSCSVPRCPHKLP